MNLPKLRSVLLALNLLVFVLPLGALTLLRTYDHQLIRQTESELLVQEAFVAESYRHALASALGVFDEPAPTEPSAGDMARDLAAETALPTAEDGVAPTQPPSADDLVAARVGAALAPVLQRAAQQTLAGIRLLDSRGVVVASSGTELGLSLADRREVQLALQGQPASLLRHRRDRERDAPLTSASRNTGLRAFVAQPLFIGGRVRGAVVLARTPATLGKAFYQDRYNLLATTLVLLLTVLLVSLGTAAVVVRPVHALAERARAIADGRTEAPLGRPRTAEVAALSDAVTRMGTALQQRADTIRAFAANVSHEFKTPLTSLRGTVELLQESFGAMDAEQRRRFLEILDADIARLNRLVDRLMELARADVARPGDGRTVLPAALAELKGREAAAGHPVAIELGDGLPAARIAPAFFEAVLDNLVHNAWQHGATQVWIAATAVAGQVRLVVKDDGPGISHGNRDRVFEPFFTTARDAGGTGLGLTIAQTLAQAHQGGISLLADDPAQPGARFELALPAG